jgi:hypothetical protein
MAYVPKKTKQKASKLTKNEQIERDTMAFAQLLYDIWQEKKLKEKNNDLSSNK